VLFAQLCLKPQLTPHREHDSSGNHGNEVSHTRLMCVGISINISSKIFMFKFSLVFFISYSLFFAFSFSVLITSFLKQSVCSFARVQVTHTHNLLTAGKDEMYVSFLADKFTYFMQVLMQVVPAEHSKG